MSLNAVISYEVKARVRRTSHGAAEIRVRAYLIEIDCLTDLINWFPTEIRSCFNKVGDWLANPRLSDKARITGPRKGDESPRKLNIVIDLEKTDKPSMWVCSRCSQHPAIRLWCFSHQCGISGPTKSQRARKLIQPPSNTNKLPKIHSDISTQLMQQAQDCTSNIRQLWL